jgi:class 3 adenylate cyclase
MQAPVWSRRALERLMAIGEVPGESETRRGGRRVFLVALVLATALTVPQILADLVAGHRWVAGLNTIAVIVPLGILVLMWRWPRRFDALLSAMFAVIMLAMVGEVILFGGLLASGLVPIFGLVVALAALLVAGTRLALVWFGVFVAIVVFSVFSDRWIEPRYRLADPTADGAFSLIATGIVTMAIIVYFVRQRDLFQRRSDDLLHNALPDVIAHRLREGSRIADDVPAASVLFADVVDFTPMSASMTPAELVGLLDELFTAFDGSVAELGLEKIKTVGNAYMAAAGVPVARDDHAIAIAELALRMRDHVATTPVGGRSLRIRIGIASGPVTAGVIGTHRFAYDLWGDTVNTASRMESSGLAGEIQITPETYTLVRERFRCQPRGPIRIKGKDEMITYLLLERREHPVRIGAPDDLR